MINDLVYWTVDDLKKAVDMECLYAGYGDDSGPYEASYFYTRDIWYVTAITPEQPVRTVVKEGTRLRFSNEFRITGTTGWLSSGNGNIDVKLYPIENIARTAVEELP